jgi:hypothetical protein
MWVVKTHGVTFYVDHVTAEIPWSTKETSSNPSTKGSIKFKRCKLTIDNDNCATLSRLTLLDHNLDHPKVVHARVLFGYGGKFFKALTQDKEFKHSTIKHVSGGCGSSFSICDLLDRDEVVIAGLKYAGLFRILAPNEAYYKDYEDTKSTYIEERYDDDDDDDDIE